MNNPLSLNVRQPSFNASIAACVRIGGIAGVLINTFNALVSGSEVAVGLGCAWFGIYLLGTQWAVRVAYREVEADEERARNLALWDEHRVDLTDARAA
ncbi:MAG TPA: hypothetical protein VF867_13285 [Arthrobacter sp.]